MTYAIQTDMPIPPASKGGRPSKYPLAKMQVGDSFVVPLADASAKQIRQAVAAFSRRSGFKFVVREIGGGTAVWKK